MFETTVNRVVATGDGTTNAISFPYLFYADGDIEVVSVDLTTGVETTLTLSTHYTISGAGNPLGGSVTPVSGTYFAVGVKWVIRRIVDQTQTTDLANSAGIDAEVVEKRFDLLTMIAQQLQENIDRAILSDLLATAYDFGAKKIINLADPTLIQDAATKNYVDSVVALATLLSGDEAFLAVAASGVGGTADAITLTDTNFPGTPTALVKARFVPKANNTGPVTVTIGNGTDTWAAKALVDADGDALGADALVADIPCEIVYGAESDKAFLLGFGNVDLSAYALISSLSAYAQFGAKQTWTKAQKAGPQAVAYAATVTPDLSGAPDVQIAAATGALQINLPTNTQVGDLFTIQYAMDATGSRAITLVAGYKNQPSAFAQGANARGKLSCEVMAVSGTTATEVWIWGALNEDDF